MKKRIFDAETYINGILQGDTVILSQAITLLESTRTDHQTLGQAVLQGCMPHAGKSVRIGITGVPGVGKSTFIEAFGQHVISENHKIAVLAIDPSSRLNRGSILGDKTRMNLLSMNKNAYIRPSAAGESLGGVARRTKETILLCEAAGFDIIIIETVGVGQSETAVRDLTDFFLLLLLPNAGDELQGMKRGIVEMCDWIAINKCDTNPTAAKLARIQYANALHLFPAKMNNWTANASLCSAITQEGITEIWQIIVKFEQENKNNHSFFENRNQQNLFWLKNAIQERVLDLFYKQEKISTLLPYLEQQVVKNEISVTRAVELCMSDTVYPT
jgi:LAO/AO transport system kinase